MVLIAGALRSLIADAIWKGTKLLCAMFIGALLMLGGCTVTASGAGVLAMMGIATMPTSTSNTSAAPVANEGGGFIVVLPPISLTGGFVSDLYRYQLALDAGWTGENAIIAVAVSITEDPPGDPAIEHVNDDGSVDKGLWQINSIHWVRFGGRYALADPATNAWAAHVLWLESAARGNNGFQPWTTFTTGRYMTNMARARAASVTINTTSTQYEFPLPGWSGQINLHWGKAIGGSDLFAPQGWPVVSVSSGKVQEAGSEAIGGNNVLIRGEDGLLYYYAHFVDFPSVHVGQTVAPGILLGHVGNTGDAIHTATHLHIGIGHTILLGKDAYGGTGSGFDAVSFLHNLYTRMHNGG